MAVQTEPMQPPESPRKGRRTGVASELSVLLKVKPGREQRLREELTTAVADTAQHAEGQKDSGGHRHCPRSEMRVV